MLELYQFEGCPFCRKVRERLSDWEIDYICRNVRYGSPKWKQFEKLNPGGQVPFLVDPGRGVALDESQRILDYVGRYYVKVS